MRCTEDACLVSRPIKLPCPAINKCQWAKWNSIFCPFHIPYWKWSIAYSVMQWSPIQQQYLWDTRPFLLIAAPCHVSEIFCFVIAVFLHCSQLCSKGKDSRSIASSKQKSTSTKYIYFIGVRICGFVLLANSHLDLILVILTSSSTQIFIAPCRSVRFHFIYRQNCLCEWHKGIWGEEA